MIDLHEIQQENLTNISSWLEGGTEAAVAVWCQSRASRARSYVWP